VLFVPDDIENKVHIKGYGRCRQHPNAMQGAMIINIENVTNACDLAVGSAIANAEKFLTETERKNGSRYLMPRKVIMGIAGELVKGITIMADYEREDPKGKIDEKELKEVIGHIKEQAFSDAVADIAEDIGVNAGSLMEINTKINATYIDGVKVDDPKGFTGKSITYRVFSTFAPALHVNSLKEVARNLNLQIISIEVEPYAVARAVNGGRKENYASIIIDIGGGTSDIAVIDHGVVAGTKMFAFGGRVFSKRIANDLNKELNEAEEIKIKYSSGNLPAPEMSRVRSALSKDLAIWAEGVEIGLKEVEEDVESYPTSIYICGGASALPEMKLALQEHAWLQVLPFAKFPKVEFLYPKLLAEIEDSTKSINDPADITPLALARMYLENKENHDRK
jgi:cell division protein FtsA